MKKVIKKGIKKAVLFYFDEDQQLPRMVMFGPLDKMMPFYLKMMKMGFKRLQDIIKKAGGKEDMSVDEMLEIVRGTRPPWMDDNYSTAGEKAEMSLTYEVKKVK